MYVSMPSRFWIIIALLGQFIGVELKTTAASRYWFKKNVICLIKSMTDKVVENTIYTTQLSVSGTGSIKYGGQKHLGLI